mgnify:CR=1 FL=1
MLISARFCIAFIRSRPIILGTISLDLFAVLLGGVVALLALGQFTAPLLLGRTKGIDVITTQLYRLTGAPPANSVCA